MKRGIMKKSIGMQLSDNSRFIQFDSVELAQLAFTLLDQILQNGAASQSELCNCTMHPSAATVHAASCPAVKAEYIGDCE